MHIAGQYIHFPNDFEPFFIQALSHIRYSMHSSVGKEFCKHVQSHCPIDRIITDARLRVVEK